MKREYTRALIRDYAQDCEVTLVGARKSRGLRRSRTFRHAGGRRRIARRDRALLSRWRGAHRYGRARLHALPAVARSTAKAQPLAGEFHRSGARHRATRRHSSEKRSSFACCRRDTRDFHVRPNTGKGTAAFRHCRQRSRKRLGALSAAYSGIRACTEYRLYSATVPATLSSKAAPRTAGMRSGSLQKNQQMYRPTS